MKVLILSCKTGGGHNAAGQAVAKQLMEMGEEAYFFDYLTLAGQKVSDTVGGSYVGLVKRVPLAFGLLYRLGAIVSRIMRKSPVYYMNSLMAPYLNDYLQENEFDAIVMPHLFPAETITYMKRKGMEVPFTVAVATDYTCIPFWRETECDYYVIPSEELRKEFTTGRIKSDQLLPFGIPVSPDFTLNVSKVNARKELGITHNERIYLIAGGSMGAGQMKNFVGILSKMKKENEHIIVICGSNKKVKKKIYKSFRKDHTITVLGQTNQMHLYMKACDIIYTKPGGLTSTEAAVAEIPMIHTSPIPGCESRNRRYFRKHGMSVSARETLGQAAAGVRLLENTEKCEKMKGNQRAGVPKDAAYQIYKFLKKHTGC